MKNFLSLLLIAALSLLPGSLLFSQDAEPGNVGPERLSLLEFFQGQHDSLPLLKLETDWGKLVKGKMKEEYQSGVLSFRQTDGSSASLDIKLRARGNIRKEVCFYPPLKIKMKKKQLVELGFKPVNGLKLVLPCKNGDTYRDCLLREALAYHFYEAIHPIHIKTKVVKLEGWEAGEQKHSFTAFLVEDEEELAARLDARVLGQGVVRASGLDRDSYLKMCFFQYMIANVDWSVGNRHNLEFLQVPGYERIVVIPYDFDYAGFIGASYAVPAPSLPIKNVNQRYFLGKEITKEEALECAKFFLDKKDEIIGRCASFGLLEERDINSSQKVLSKFFDLLEDEKRVIRTFANE